MSSIISIYRFVLFSHCYLYVTWFQNFFRWFLWHSIIKYVLTVFAFGVCSAVDSAIWHQLQISILEEHLYSARRARYVAQVRRALRTLLGRGRSGARGQRQRRQQQPQRARALTHGAPRPWQPPGRRHCTTPTIPPPSHSTVDTSLVHLLHWPTDPVTHSAPNRTRSILQFCIVQSVFVNLNSECPCLLHGRHLTSPLHWTDLVTHFTPLYNAQCNTWQLNSLHTSVLYLPKGF